MHIQNPTLPNHPTTTTTLSTYLSPLQTIITALPTSSHSDYSTIANINATSNNLNADANANSHAEFDSNTNINPLSILSVLFIFLLLATLIFSFLSCHIRAGKTGECRSSNYNSNRDSNSNFGQKRKGYSKIHQSEEDLYRDQDQDGSLNGTLNLIGNLNGNMMARSHRVIIGGGCPKSILRWRREGCVMGRRGVKGSVPACVKVAGEEREGNENENENEIPVLVKRVSWPDGGEEGKRLEERFVEVYLLERDEMDGGDGDGGLEGRRGSDETLVNVVEVDLDRELI